MKISVIMPVYNGEKYLTTAISSVLNQTFADFEFIIVNDGSTDSSEKIINSFNDSRIVYIKNEKNEGIVSSLNNALRIAKGKYIARMDADDIAMKERLEKQFNVMENDKTIDVLGTGTEIFGEGIKTYQVKPKISPKKLKAELLFNPCVCHPSVMIRKETLDRYSITYKEEFKGAEDFELWWQIANIGKICVIPDVLHRYRIHGNQVTQNKDVKYRHLLLKLLDVRLSTLDIILTENEKNIFIDYCMNNFSKFDAITIKKYIDCIAKIVKKNKKIKFFDDYYLKEVCSLSIVYLINNTILNSSEKKDCINYLFDIRIVPLVMKIKFYFHGIRK